uniref:Retrovirus-related Pol polyprotein from transposon TNT 1-94 n=1 Tax=Cajanus cajan TaxID=3821 RepID=A0A151RC07_CAJCA|nr:hypothetical protein KK1_038550 [Cajanus cajan]
MPTPVCGCPVRCTCTSGIRIARYYHDLNCTIRFLTSLNDNFFVVKSQIMLMDPLPKLNPIFSMVLQHERQIGFISNDESNILINFFDYKNS